jgi:pimeloyl-ACP methyl ester carboxylesterase
MQAIAALGPEQLVLIGHSRGACDALAFALRNPEFVKQRIRALFLIQGPFGGTAVADFVAGEGQPMDRRMPAGYRLMGRVVGGLEPRVLEDNTHQAIASLNRKDSEGFWNEALFTHRAAVPVVGPKTFYVTSRTHPSHHPIFQRITGWYLGTYYGPNDGLVTLEDQSLRGLGTVLAVLDVGHTDLTRRFPAARPRHRLRSALVDAIIMAVGEVV